MAFSDDPCAGLEVYRVGGAVRDALLGRPVTDTDWVVVGATVDDMRRRGFRAVGRDFPVFLHPHTHEEFALARTERKSGRGYTGFSVHASPDVTLEEDLARRDLTINAMAETADGRLVDPFGGQADLRARRLRHVSAAFVEDPLRVLRTARFLARYAPLGFTIAEETLALMAELATSGELAHLVPERVWAETEKALGEPSPAAYFCTLDECGALALLMPELKEDSRAGHALAPALNRMTRLPEVLDDVTVWRWGRLVEALDAPLRRRLAERLKLPNAYRQAGELTARTRALARTDPDAADAAEAVMDWLDGIDAWRRGERIPPLLAIVAQDFPELARRAEAGWRAACAIQAKALVGKGFKGRELGRELARRRREALAAALDDRK
ncbi:MAG TPA: polynucleotide adenylyltransferase [Halomonas sp.]|nr:polynucleotide adenylyltransferase [Halomonas sp.]